MTKMPEPGAAGLIGRLEMSDYGILNIKDKISLDLAIKLLGEIGNMKGWTEKPKEEKR